MEKAAMAPRHRRGLASWSVLAILGPLLCLGPWGQALAQEPLRILAAASTISALDEATRLFARKHGIRVVGVFASSGKLARQLAAGAPGDLYLSADPKWMNWAQFQRVIDPRSRRTIFGNRLVLAVTKGSGYKLEITRSLDLPKLLGDGRLAIADPAHAPLGAHAKTALLWMGAWGRLARRALRLADAAQARALVERGEAKFGILYQSDVTANTWIEAAGVFPPESHRKIRYEIALTRSAAKDAGAQKFHKWLLGAAAGKIFARFGFEVK